MDNKSANRLLGHIALAILIFTIAAFALKVVVHPERAARYTPLVILHGTTMLAWIGMVASQAYLAAAGKLKQHRKFGKLSPILVLATIASGMTVSWNLSQEFNRYELLVGNTGVFVTFVALYVTAIMFARRHKQGEHRMAMLIATLATLGPAYARITDVLDWPDMAGLPVQLLVTFGIAICFDWKTRGSVARSTWAMLGFNVVILALTIAAFFAVLPTAQ